MPKGTVDKYSEDKGFGFIKQDDDGEILFERSSLNMEGYELITPGARVSFGIKKTIRGKEATNVERI